MGKNSVIYAYVFKNSEKLLVLKLYYEPTNKSGLGDGRLVHTNLLRKYTTNIFVPIVPSYLDSVLALVAAAEISAVRSTVLISCLAKIRPALLHDAK